MGGSGGLTLPSKSLLYPASTQLPPRFYPSSIRRALEQDERTFHAWNYRQFVVKMLGRSPQEELAYAEEKV